MAYWNPETGPDSYYDPQQNTASIDTGAELRKGIGLLAAGIGLNLAGVALQGRIAAFGKSTLKNWAATEQSVIRRSIAEKVLKSSNNLNQKILNPIKEGIKSSQIYKAANARTKMLNEMRESGAPGYSLKRFTSAFQNPNTFVGAVGGVWRKNVLSGIGVAYAVDNLLGFTRDLGLEKKKWYDVPGQISNFAKWGTMMTLTGTAFGAAGPVIGAIGSLGMRAVGKVFQSEIGSSFLRNISDKFGRVQLDERFTKYGNKYNLLSQHEHKFVAEATQKRLHFGKNLSEAYGGLGEGITRAYNQFVNKKSGGSYQSRTQKAFGVLGSSLRLAMTNLTKKTGKDVSSNIYHGLDTIKKAYEFSLEAKAWSERNHATGIKFGEIDDLNKFFNSTFKRQNKQSTLQKLFGNILKPVRLKDVTNKDFQEEIYANLRSKYATDHAMALRDNLLNLHVGKNIYRNPGIKGGMVDLNFLDPISMMKKAISPILSKSISVPLTNSKFNFAEMIGIHRWLSDDPDVFLTRQKPNFSFVDHDKGQYSVSDLTNDESALYMYTKGGKWAAFDSGGIVHYANTNRNLGLSYRHSFDKSQELKQIISNRVRQKAAQDLANANDILTKADHGIYPKNNFLGFLEHKGIQLPAALTKFYRFIKGQVEGYKGYKLEYGEFFNGDPTKAVEAAYLMQNVHEIGDQVLAKVSKDPKAIGKVASYVRDTKLRENLLAATLDNQSLMNSIIPIKAELSKDKNFVRSLEMVQAFPEVARNHSIRHPIGEFSRMTDWDNLRVSYIDNVFDDINNLNISKSDPHPLLNAAHSWYNDGIITANERDALLLRGKIHSFKVDCGLFSPVEGKNDTFVDVVKKVRQRSKEQHWDTLNELINFSANNKLPKPAIRSEQDKILSEIVNLPENLLPFSSAPNKPMEAFSEFASNTIDRVTTSIGEYTPFKKYYLSHSGIKGNAKFFGKVIGYTAMAFAGYRTLDFLTATNPIFDDTMFDEGITGVGADVAAKARLGLARVADFTGLTSAFKYFHGLAPYSETAIPGAIAGGALALFTKANPIAAASWTFFGGVINRMASPYLPDMTKSHQELVEIYSGRKQVPIMKSPTWLLGGTPWEGTNVIGYSPNWYIRAKSRWKETDTMYGSAFQKFIHEPLPLLGFNIGNILDPYYMERKHYYTRPYPVTGGPFDEIPVVGRVLSSTVGRIIKPPKTMHQEYLQRGMNQGGEPGDPYPFAVRPPTIPENLTVMNQGPGPGQTTAGKAANYGKATLMNNKYWSETAAEDFLYDIQNFAGLKGFLAGTITERIFNQNKVIPTLETAGRMSSFSRSYYDMNLGGIGVLSEPIRRLVEKPEYRQYGLNPIPNRMPDWLPSKYTEGDPYIKILRGELRLPGSAYLSTHTDVRRTMPARASMIGGNIENIVQYFAGLIPPTQLEEYETMEEGTAFHRSIQETLASEGLLIQAEALVQDVKNDITGHADAIIREGTGGGGRRLLEIKTINEKSFQSLDAPKGEHYSQINFYLKNFNLKNGTILYVNRDNPAQVKTFQVHYSHNRWLKDIKKLQKARSIAQSMMDEGVGDTLGFSYSWADRLKILADVAPNSLEYKEAKKIVETQIKFGAADKLDQEKYNEALKMKQARIRSYELYPIRFKGKVLSPETSTNIQSINEDIKSAADYSLPERIIGAAWETFTNENTFLVNKFFAAKDPLEHYKMTRLYGKEYKPWDEPIRGWVDPYMRSLASKTNPFSGATSFGSLGYLLGGGPIGAIIGGTLGAGYGSLHGLYRTWTNTTYIPESVQEKRAIVSYFDAAKYAKNDMLAQLSTGLTQQEYLKQKNATLSAFNQGGKGATVANLFRATSPFEKPYIESWLNTRDPEERDRIISMVPEDLAQALKRQWNTNDNKDATSIYNNENSNQLSAGGLKYSFNKNIMDPRIQLEDIELKTIQQAGLDQFEFGLGWNEQLLRIQESRNSIQATNIERLTGNEIPNSPNMSPANIRGIINNLFSQNGIRSSTQIYIDQSIDVNQLDFVIRRDRSKTVLNALNNRDQYGL